MKFEHESAFGSLGLQLRNNGSLPAFVERVWTAAHPWDQYPATSLDPHITEQINKYIATPLKPRGVIFPQQAVSEPSGYGIMKSQIDIARNQAMGLVIVIRGVVRYTYPVIRHPLHYVSCSHIQSHWLGCTGRVGALPTENGALVPAVELLVTNWMGQTDAT